jgi:hypothetical protein
MAIKGKKRSRNRPRVVATAPRPYLVPAKTPLMRRKSTQFVLLLVLFGAIAGVATAYRISRDNREHLQSVQEFENQVERPIIDGDVGQPTAGKMLILPEMGQAIGQLLGGQGKPEELLKPADQWERSATEAAEAVAGVDTDLQELKEARNGMAQGLRLYGAIAADLQLVPGVDGRVRERLVRNVGEELAVAAEVFDSGWAKLLVERHRAGLPDPSIGLPPGFPGGGSQIPLPGGG